MLSTTYSKFTELQVKLPVADTDAQRDYAKELIIAVGADGSYSISRPLFIYVKNAHIGSVPGLLEFAEEFVSDKAAGPDGYLSIKGLISLPNKELIEMEKRVSALTASAKSN